MVAELLPTEKASTGMEQPTEDYLLFVQTRGERTGARYPSRRRFEFFVSDPDKVEEVSEIVENWMKRDLKYTPSFDWEEYVHSFCIKCDHHLCFRHLTVGEAGSLLLNYSNHLYQYWFFEDHFQFEVGASRWSILGNKDQIVIRRPSGRVFTFRNHGYFSSYTYFLMAVLEFLDWVEEHSYVFRSKYRLDDGNAGKGEI